MKTFLVLRMAVSIFVILSIGNLFAQVPTPNVNLTYMGVIPVPIWTPAGTTSASFDLFSFNPVTRFMYQADWRNHGALVIDTITNTLVDIIKPTDCTGTTCPSGVLVMPDLQKLVLTSR